MPDDTTPLCNYGDTAPPTGKDNIAPLRRAALDDIMPPCDSDGAAPDDVAPLHPSDGAAPDGIAPLRYRDVTELKQ